MTAAREGRSRMDVMSLVLAGLLGAAAVDGFELWRVVRARRGVIPGDWRDAAFLVGSLIRVGAGAAFAGLLAALDQVSGPIGAFVVGGVGPLLLRALVDLAATAET